MKKLGELIRNWWPIFTAIVAVIFFFGIWYHRTCALEQAVQNIGENVEAVVERVEKVERNLTSLEYTATATATAVHDIQDILLTDRISRRSLSARD